MPLPSAFARKLANVALQQHHKYQFVDENDPPLAPQIRRYWTELGFDFPGVETAWSAVFVSWCVKTAGTTPLEFRFAFRHSEFVHWAIANARSQTGLFQAFDIDSYAPNVGDIIQWNRNGNRFNFTFAAANDRYESHSAIVVETGQDSRGRYAFTVGGNESDSIRRKTIILKPNGFIKQRTSSPYISVIRNLK